MEDEAIELDEFEIFRSRAYSKKRTGSTKNIPYRASRRLLQPRPTSSASLPDHREKQDSSDRSYRDDTSSVVSFREDDILLKKTTNDSHKPHVDRLCSSPVDFNRRQLSPSRLGRSYSCRPRTTKPRVKIDVSSSRPRINSLAEATEVLRHRSLSSQNALARDSGEFQIYRVRSFTTTAKGIVNRGDSFKVRSPLCRRPLLSGSNDDIASSRASIATSIGKIEGSIIEDEVMTDTQPSARNVVFYRALICGAQGVGKTSLAQQFMTSEYLGNMDALPDDSAEIKVCVQLDDQEVMVEFLDENSNTGCDVEDPDALVIIYDVTDRDSFRFAEGRLREIRSSEEGCRPSVVILVANKEDLVRNRVVSAEDGVKIAHKYSCKYTEVSAILNHKVDELLVGIVRQIRLHPERDISSQSDHSRMYDDDNDTFSCLPQAVVDLFQCIIGKKEELSKSCENLLVL